MNSSRALTSFQRRLMVGFAFRVHVLPHRLGASVVHINIQHQPAKSITLYIRGGKSCIKSCKGSQREPEALILTDHADVRYPLFAL